MDAIKAQLDELMGVERNVPIKERRKNKETYEDPEVCKHNLVSVCPHDLFPNTKMDLGKCPKRHEEFYRRLFLQDENRYNNEKRYINETINLFESLLAPVDSKIKKAMQKLESTANEEDQPQELVEKLKAIDEEIKRQLDMSEKLGDEGRIEESEGCMAQVESLRKRKEEIKLAGDLSAANRHMKVCEICGAMQAINDTDKRALAHLEGKLHTGFAILRKELEYLHKRREELKNLAVMSRKEREKQREKDDERERERDRERNKDNERDRGREKDREERSRDRSGSRSRHKRKHRRSRSRSRSHKRSYSRDRDRKHKKEKKHRRERSRSRSDSSSRSRSRSESRKHKKKSHRHKKDRSPEQSKDGHSNGDKPREEQVLDNLAKQVNGSKDSDRRN